jgi:hypothetical protein
MIGIAERENFVATGVKATLVNVLNLAWENHVYITTIVELD